MTEAQERFEAVCASLPGAKRGAMFGWECYKAGAKPFAFFDRDSQAAAAFKLSGPDHAEALALDGAAPFSPGSGRPMKNWVLLPLDQAAHWPRFAEAAFRLLLSEPASAPRRKKHGT
jgi:hypothetical protein